jgi:hypothetical protein
MINCEASENIVFQLYRNGTKIGTGGNNCWQGTAPMPYDSNTGSTLSQVNIKYIDSPNTTSPVTYTVCARSSGSLQAYTLFINRCTANLGEDNVENAVSHAFARQLGGAITVSNAFVVSGSNVYLPSGSNMAIGKSNAAYALDVVGEINASSNIRINGQSLQGLGVPNQVVLTSGSGSWSVPVGVTQIQVQAVGGGGGGAGGSASAPYGASGGGAGGFVQATINVQNIANITYNVGAGGAGGASSSSGSHTSGTAGSSTIFGNTAAVSITCTGGGAGVIQSGNTVSLSGNGGLPTISGTATVSSLIVTGGDGHIINTFNNDNDPSSMGGGASYFGGGGSGGSSDMSSGVITKTPQNGKAYGSGGAGGRNPAPSAGSGASGVVIITYFTQSGLPNNYTATAPLSMSGTALSIAAATTSAPGVVQVGNGLSVSSGTLSVGTRTVLTASSSTQMTSGLSGWAYGHPTNSFVVTPGKLQRIHFNMSTLANQSTLLLDLYDNASSKWISDSGSTLYTSLNAMQNFNGTLAYPKWYNFQGYTFQMIGLNNVPGATNAQCSGVIEGFNQTSTHVCYNFNGSSYGQFVTTTPGYPNINSTAMSVYNSSALSITAMRFIIAGNSTMTGTASGLVIVEEF